MTALSCPSCGQSVVKDRFGIPRAISGRVTTNNCYTCGGNKSANGLEGYLASAKAEAAPVLAAKPIPQAAGFYCKAPEGYVFREHEVRLAKCAVSLVAMVETALFTIREVEKACDDIADNGVPGFRILAEQMIDFRRELERLAAEAAP